MGATDGVIMPTIITDHMANMNAKSTGPQALNAGRIAPAIALMSIPPMSVSAMWPLIISAAVSASMPIFAASRST